MSSTLKETTSAQLSITPDEVRAIARDAYIYGFPLVDNYRIQYSYFVDTTNIEYKAPWNTIYNTARVYTPADKTIQTPNSDTPYSFIGADLRAEPLVLTMPVVDAGRYYSAQFIDMYTFNFAYVGSRTTGNRQGSYVLAGPRWQGEKPPGTKEVIRCETEFAFILYRTQLFDPGDIENVKRIQAGYKVQPLSTFLGEPKLESQNIDFPKPLTAVEQRSSLEFFRLLNYVLQFCPTHSSEIDLMKRFATIGIGAFGKFDPKLLSPLMRELIQLGIDDAWQEKKKLHNQIVRGDVDISESFGNREYLNNHYLLRMVATTAGIYGNSKEEAIYHIYYLDSLGDKLDTTANKYSLRFPFGELPPVNAFWSVTLYEFPSQLLSENPINRYLINSPMLPNLVRDKDGSITIYIQHDSPGSDKEPNWLPAPKKPIKLALRLYAPRPQATNGDWKAPELVCET